MNVGLWHIKYRAFDAPFLCPVVLSTSYRLFATYLVSKQKYIPTYSFGQLTEKQYCPNDAWRHMKQRRWMALPRPAQRPSFFQRIREEFVKEARKSKDLQKNLEELQKTKKTSTVLRIASSMAIATRTILRVLFSSIRYILMSVYSVTSKSLAYLINSAPIRMLRNGASKLTSGIFVNVTSSSYAKKLGATMSEVKRNIIEEHSIGYGGYKPREVRLREREKRMRKEEDIRLRKYGPLVAENPSAGSSVVLSNSQDSLWKEKWAKIKGVFSNVETADPSSTTAELRERLGSFFSETETALVVKALLNIDPSFRLQQFLFEAQEYIIPEILDAMNREDMNVIRQWCSERICLVQSALLEDRRRRGLSLDAQIIDLRRVDLLLAKMIEETPMLYVVFETQEIEVLRDRSGKIVEGRDDVISRHRQIWVFTCDPASIGDPTTKGWKVVDAEIQHSLPIW